MCGTGDKMKRNKCFFAFGARRRRWSFLAALAVLLLAAPARLSAERQGSALRLDLLDGRRLQGELLAVRGEVLILQTWSGTATQAGIRDVARLRIMRENRVARGLASGMLAGFAVGSLIALPFTFSRGNEYSLLPLIVFAGMGGGFGAVIGAGAGIVASTDETIQCQGRSDAWRAVMLKRLQRLARFREDERPAIAGSPPLPREAEFKRWHLGITFAQSPPMYTRTALAFIRGFRYEDPVSPGMGTSARMSDDNARTGWVGLSEVRCDYSLDRRWTIGILFDPFSGRNSVGGTRELRIAGQDAEAYWDMPVWSRTYFLAASYSILAADGFLHKNALQLGAGLGWNRSRCQYFENGFGGNPNNSLDPASFYYHANSDMLSSSSLSALVRAEAARYFNSRWSLALAGGFRYVPLRIRGQEVIGRITRHAPFPGQDCLLTIPRSTLNAGGFYLGVTLNCNL